MDRMNTAHSHLDEVSHAEAVQAGAVPVRTLRPVFAYLVLGAWTLFSVYIYSRYSQLGDSQAYLTGSYDDESQGRTQLITWLSTKVMALAHSELLAHLVFAMFAATGVAYLIKQAGVHGRYCWPLFAILLNPNFGVWASVTGREPLFVGLLGFFMGAVLAYYRKPGYFQLPLALVALAGMIFVRGPYGLALALFLLMFLAYRSGPQVRLSLGVQALLFLVVGLGGVIIAWPYLDAYVTEDVLPRAKSYFTLYSATTRTWIHLRTTGDLLTSLWWSLPLALVGPTPAEVWRRPEMAPFLLSGLVVLATLLHSIFVSLRAPRGSDVRKILLLGWLPAMAIILVTYVPFGIYNPGSGIRYASSFLLFLIFPSMLMSTVATMSATVIPADTHPRLRWRRI